MNYMKNFHFCVLVLSVFSSTLRAEEESVVIDQWQTDTIETYWEEESTVFQLEAVVKENTLENAPSSCEQYKPICCFKTEIDAYVSMTFGKSIGVDQNYASFGTWITRSNDQALYFLDARWHHLCDQENGLNGGLGVRVGDGCKGCGINCYYDWRRFDSKNFNQVDAAIEGWVFPWEFHLNVYLPSESASILDESTIDFVEGYHFSSRTTAYPCKMVAALFGRQFAMSRFLPLNTLFLVMAGPYALSMKENRNVYGGIASIDFLFYDLFSWKTIASYDSIFKTRVNTTISINIPFGCNWKCFFDKCSTAFSRRPVRQDLIPIETKTRCSWNWSSP